MGRQLVKGLAMLALLVTLALATTVATAKGQDQVKANVPFDFIVGDKTLESGQYKVSEILSADALSIRGEDSKDRAIRLANTIAPQKKKQARLVFHRYGNTYFLAEVWQGGNEVGRQLLKSRQERAMQRERSRIADNRTNTYEEIVVLASVQ